MAPVRQTRKRKSNFSASPVEGQKIPTLKGSPHRSPIKKRKLGLTLAHKQAIVENMQLELTERARRLRAQYNIQAQQLRARVEMRVNRIPRSLRKAKMGELLAKSLQPQQPPRIPKPAAEMSGADKENQGNAVENPKKRLRGAPAKEPAHIQPEQILSPTSSNTNTRNIPRQRPASPTKTMISRPASPVKGPPPKASSNILTSMAERVKASRPATGARKATNTSTTSSNNGTTTRTRQATVTSRPPTAASTRGRRKVSATSEASNGSSSTVVKKTTASRAAKTTAPPAKRTMMSTLKSATTKKPPASKAATGSTATGTGRTLRKRG
ncbi:Borealin N terminal-domain-containing protein [Jackrogersella minutella]|nr:Borealin N terminal-domain-containing protein [Jackrogersella minutella]